MSKVVLIALASFFCIFVNTHSGIEETPESFLEVSRLYKLSKIKTFLKVYLLNALPQILTGLQLALGVSWMALVGAEMISASSGIGYHMNDARSVMRSDKVIADMLVIGIVGILMSSGVSGVFGLLTPWKSSDGQSVSRLFRRRK
jgi:sulfonate transport system permease protein